MSTTPHRIENTIPVLAVADVAASIQFFCDLLDFRCDWKGNSDPLFIASVSRDGHPIMLQRRSPGGGGWVWIGTSNLRPIWERIRSREDVQIVQNPTNQPFALEMKIKDPDGNVIWFGAAPLTTVPFGEQPAEF